jgi:hypothetical protein
MNLGFCIREKYGAAKNVQLIKLPCYNLLLLGPWQDFWAWQNQKYMPSEKGSLAIGSQGVVSSEVEQRNIPYSESCPEAHGTRYLLKKTLKGSK